MSSLFATVVVAEPTVSEEAYVEAAPEKGDAYFEAAASDGSWISYKNPRDEYRSPYLGDGSAKICVALHNENGEPIVGETLPNTTITIPTGDAIGWHSSADPITVQLPLTEHYDRPLDADQFGTSDLPQGNGYMDSHCYEFHGLTEDETVEYGEATVDGEHADRLEVVGYVQHAHSAWDSDVDPIADAESYEEAGGGWTYYPGGSHRQVVVVLQLDSEDGSDGGTHDGDGTDEAEESSDANEDDGADEDAGMQSSADSEVDEMPGFGVPVALVALSIVALARTRR
ncbi:PGF-CTERM sorting domain-containing protein [Halalkalicoccus salilacus]|uniref:PGF-CTERM sorting domain-containing protein n=1 Tax=Halalkalicoccus salilacus TaxID=3117459 RepID=UPI0038D3E73E